MQVEAGGRSRQRGWTASLVLLVLTLSLSIVTVYEVHQHQESTALLLGKPVDQLDEWELHGTMKALESDQSAAEATTAAIEAAAAVKASSQTIQETHLVSAQDACHVDEHNEYMGNVVKWGANHFKDTPGDCCQACRDTADCNAWVWCANPDGCGNERKHKECWLKQESVKNLLDAFGHGHPGIPWTSGAVYAQEEADKIIEAEKKRLEDLKNNPELPLVYLDVAIKGKPIGKIKMVLFTKEAPRAAENFRALCTGEKGTVPPGHEGAGKTYHFKGKPFYRIIHRFIDQAGAHTDSVFGGQFKDDPGGLALKHDRKGLLSMANGGPDTNTSHFSILLAPAPHLNGHYTIFGEVVEGMEVVEEINKLSIGKSDNTATAADGAMIVDSGQIR